MRKIIVSVTNDLVTDNRVHKVCTSLSQASFDVLLVGRKLKFSQPIKRDYKTHRITLLFNKGFLFYAEYNFRLFFYLLFKKTDILLSNDLDTLTANYIVSKIKRNELVYDSHEYFTEVPELIHRKGVRSIWLWIEKHTVPGIKKKYTVCQSLADEYYKKYNTKFHVIRNVPLKINKECIPSKIEIPEDKKIIIYQGALNVGRGIETVIHAMRFLSGVSFIIVGEGDISNKLKEIVKIEKLENSVIFLGRVPFEELRSITEKADLGISLEENMGLNYFYSLPNKIFDYIHAGVPVISTDFPEQKKIVEDFHVGISTREKDPQSLAEIIKDMLFNEEKSKEWKLNLTKASEELCWEKEEKILLEMFESAKN